MTVKKTTVKRTAAKPKATTTAKSASKPSKAPAKPKGTKTPPTKPTARKTAAAPAKAKAKVTAKAATPKAPRVDGRERDERGFAVGSSQATIAELLIQGGESRHAIGDAAVVALKDRSRTANLKGNIGSMVSNGIKILQEKGYSIESSYKLVPPSSNGSKPTAVKKTAAPAKSKAAKPVANKTRSRRVKASPA